MKKLRRWSEYVESYGLNQVVTLSPLDLALEKIGFDFKPLLFWSPIVTLLVVGSIFAICMSFLFLFPYTGLSQQEWRDGILYSLGSGSLTGVIAATDSYWKRRKYKIPNWNKIE